MVHEEIYYFSVVLGAGEVEGGRAVMRLGIYIGSFLY